MDNITHTLIGASLAASGLRRRSRYAAAAMMIGANIPDVDVVAVPLGHSVEWRRGITHGVPALLLWPFILTGLIMLYDRWRRQAGHTAAGGGIAGDNEAVRPRQLLLVSALAVLTHPTYDWLNNYGLRWLMPFDGTWFYGDSLFIVDPYLMGVLALGVFVARWLRKRGSPRAFRPGRIAVGLGAAYTLALVGLHEVASRVAQRALAGQPDGAPSRVMTAPTAANPLRWSVIADRGTHYQTGEVHLGTAPTFRMGEQIPVGLDHPAAARAAADPRASGFLDWARWPVYRIDEGAGVLHINDVRYAAPESRGSWASVSVPVPVGGR